MRIAFSSAAHLRHHGDFAGATASAVCLAHCLLTPVVLSFFPNIIPYLPGDAWFHRTLALVIVLLGATAFVHGYLIHRRKRLLALVAAGMALILTVAWAGKGMNGTVELLLSIPGSLMLVAAHLLNRSFCHQCTTCAEHPEVCHTTDIE